MPIHGPAGLWPHSPKMAEFYVPFGNYLRFGASLSQFARLVSWRRPANVTRLPAPDARTLMLITCQVRLERERRRRSGGAVPHQARSDAGVLDDSRCLTHLRADGVPGAGTARATGCSRTGWPPT
jgi:hypothetical protein